MTRFYNLLLLFTILIIFGSCKKEEIIVPATPPLASLYFDFNNFDLFNSQKVDNLAYAGELISGWKDVVEDSIYSIISSFEEVLKAEPQYQAAQTWLWQNSSDSNTYKLFEISDVDSSYWKLYFTKTGELNNFLILDGKFNSDLTSGDWILKRKSSLNISEKFYGIFWEKDSLQKSQIRYTNLVPGSSDNGKFISIADSVENDYDTYIVVYDKAKDSYSYIQFSKITKAGRIKSFEHFGNEDWQYWNEDGTDM
jgi:hypothetical protein